MPRTLALPLLATLWAPSASHDSPSPAPVQGFYAVRWEEQDLSGPGALERLRATNPSHYRKVRAIVAALNDQCIDDRRPWIRAMLEPRSVYCSPILLTSFPPQRDVSFTMDHTRYTARVVLDYPEAWVLVRR